MNWIKKLFKKQEIEQEIELFTIIEPNIISTSYIKYQSEFLPGKTIVVDKDEEYVKNINFNKGYWFYAVNEIFRDKKRYGVYKLTKKEFYWIKDKIEEKKY